ILWRSYSLPDNGGVPGGYAGATMFSPPAVDRRAGLVYGTFGQPYTEPADVTACHAAHARFDGACERPGPFPEAVVRFGSATRRAAMVVPRAGTRAVAARVRRVAAGGDVVRGRARRREVGYRRFGRERDAGQVPSPPARLRRPLR